MVQFVNDINNNIPLYYISITLSSNAGINFQQQIIIDSNTFSSYFAGNLINCNFQDGSGNIISSYLESGETNTSTATYYWIKLPNATITTIYLVLYSISAISKDVSVSGAEPNYTSTYAEYDNGANVFNLYDNFKGTSLNTSLWLETLNGGTITINNGLSLTNTSSTSNTFLGSVNSINPQTNILEFFGYFNILGTINFKPQIGYYLNNTTGGNTQYKIENYNSAYNLGNYNGTSASDVSISTESTTSNNLFGLWANTLNTSAQLNYGTIITNSTDFVSSTALYILFLSNNSIIINTTWVRTRSYISTMPSITINSISVNPSVNHLISGSIYDYI